MRSFPKIQMTRKEGALVGLQIETGSVAATEVRGGGVPKLTATATATLPLDAFHDGEVADSEALAAALRTLFREEKLSRRVRLGIANQRVVVRNLRLPAIEDPKELAAAVRFQAQEQIPMPVDQAVLDHRVVGGSPATSEGEVAQVDVVVVAARREMIEASLKPLRDAGLRPVGVDLSAFGLIRAFGATEPDQEPPGNGAPDGASPAPVTLYCHVGAVTNLAVARRRACLFTRVSPVGLEGIAAELSTETNLPPEHADQWLRHVGLAQPLESIEGDRPAIEKTREAMEKGASSLLDELRLSLDFYGAQEGASPVEKVVLCGPGGTVPGLADHIGTALGLPLEASLPEALSDLDPISASRLTLSYGLALDQ